MSAEKSREWKGMPARQKSRLFDAMQNATIKNGAIIAPDGVDISHRLEIKPRVIESQQRYARNRSVMGRFAEENGGFVFALFESGITVAEAFPSLTQSDIARLIFIGTYTGYDGILRHPNGAPISHDALKKIIGISREHFSKFYGRIKAEDVIREDGKLIRVNPNMFQRGEVSGSFADFSRMRIYRDTVRELYDIYGKGRSVKQLALVFAVIPFLHFNTNVVCFNPIVHDTDQIHPMTVDKLAALLSYDDWRKLKAAMNKVWLGGKPAFAFVEDPYDSRKRRIIVNPRIVFAGDSNGLNWLRATAVLFN